MLLGGTPGWTVLSTDQSICTSLCIFKLNFWMLTKFQDVKQISWFSQIRFCISPLHTHSYLWYVDMISPCLLLGWSWLSHLFTPLCQYAPFAHCVLTSGNYGKLFVPLYNMIKPHLSMWTQIQNIHIFQTIF